MEKRKMLRATLSIAICIAAFSSMTASAFADSKVDNLQKFTAITVQNASINHERYYQLTPFGDADQYNYLSVQGMVGTMGYSTDTMRLNPAINIYNNMPYNDINIVHGHGAPGWVRCDLTESAGNGAWTALYAYPNSTSNSKDGFMYQYASNSLSRTKLLIFIACNSATLQSGYSLASIGYARGAKCSIGFNNSVAGGGEWLRFMISHLETGNTIQNSMDQADSDYSRYYGSYGSDNPVGHHLKYGNSNQTLKL